MKVNKKKLEKIIETPLDDSQIRHYLPDAKIMKYEELAKYNTIDDLLPNDKDYCIILVEDSPNNGHWICVLKYDGCIEYFDSYGNVPDKNLTWISCEMRKELGQTKPLLSDLFNKCNYEVIYNPVNYQGEGYDIKTCGRYCVFRVLCQKEYDLALKYFYKLMNVLKKTDKLDYNEIVSKWVDIIHN